MRLGPVLSVLLLATMWLSFAPAPAGADHVCDPYPIGRCGAYQREQVIFCFVMIDGAYISASDPDAIGVLGTSQYGVDIGRNEIDNSIVYIQPDSAFTFIGDPNTAPFPRDALWLEDNGVVGLQTSPFQCGKWTWFAECEPMQWMGPTGLVSKNPDSVVA